VRRRGLPTSQLVRMMSENPARRLGLWPRKGGLRIGADADLVVFDAERSWRVDEARLVTPCGWSPYQGRQVVGAVETVLVRGREVFARGEVVGRPGQGCWVPAQREVAIEPRLVEKPHDTGAAIGG